MQIVTEGNDLEGIEPSKSFRNAEDSVPYGTLEERAKLQLFLLSYHRGNGFAREFQVFTNYPESLNKIFTKSEKNRL